jgi:hypothetical protein
VDDDATGGAAGHSEVDVFALVEAIAPAAAGMRRIRSRGPIRWITGAALKLSRLSSPGLSVRVLHQQMRVGFRKLNDPGAGHQKIGVIT